MSHRRFRRTLWASWLGFISILVVWQFVASVGIRDPLVFPGPAAVAEAAVKNVPLTRLLEHIGISLLRVIMGFSLGAVVGITVGIVSGWYQKLGNVLRTPIEILRPIPPLAWIPLAIIWLGLGESSKVMIIFLGAFFPIFTNTFQGMITIDPIAAVCDDQFQFGYAGNINIDGHCGCIVIHHPAVKDLHAVGPDLEDY